MAQAGDAAQTPGPARPAEFRRRPGAAAAEGARALRGSPGSTAFAPLPTSRSHPCLLKWPRAPAHGPRLTVPSSLHTRRLDAALRAGPPVRVDSWG